MAYDADQVTSWAYNAPKYTELLEKIKRYENSITFVGMDDIRKQIFEKLYLVIYPSVSILWVLAMGEKGPYSILIPDGRRQVLTLEQFAEFFHVRLTPETTTEDKIIHNKNISKFANDLSKSLLIGITTTSHFQLEHFFDLIRHPLEQTIKSKISKNSEFMRKIVEIVSELGSDMEIKLDILRYMRNTLHNDGVHKNKNPIHYSIDGVKYDFENGEISNTSSWGHFYLVINEIVEILYQIVTSDTVKKFDGPLQTKHLKRLFEK